MKKIFLNKNECTLVDDSDYAFLNQFNWYVNAYGYVVRKIYKNGIRKEIRMHRLLLNAPNNLEVDHINHNTLDNRRSNIRLVTSFQNKCNTRTPKSNKIGYKGVSFHKKSGKFEVRIKCNGKKFHLGLFLNPKEGAIAYNEAAGRIFGEYACLNEIK